MLSPITRPHRMPLRTRLLWLFLPLLAASLGGIWLLSESILLSRCGEVTVLTHAKRGMDRLEPL